MTAEITREARKSSYSRPSLWIERVFSWVVLAGASLLMGSAFLFVAHPVADRLSGVGFALGCVALPIGSALALACLLAPPRIRGSLSIMVASIALSLYMLEGALWLTDPRQYGRNSVAAERAGVPYDPRSVLQVVMDLRREGKKAYPLIPAETLASVCRVSRLVPLGNISDADIVWCNEGGQYAVFKTDKHGFRNPAGVYDEKSPELVIVGDSFALGGCVGPGQDVTAVLRSMGVRAVSLANAGNGPLRNLATLTEYAASLKPKRVVWLHYEENDLQDLLEEQASPILRRYLDAGYSQDLVGKQREIDKILSAYVDDRMAGSRAGIFRQRIETGKRLALDALLLYQVRRRVGLTVLGAPNGDRDSLALLGRVLATARKRARSWGGDLCFVYLPSWRQYGRGHVDFKREQALNMARGLGIQVVDIHDVFSRTGDPLSMFPFRLYNHYNSDGYRVVAQAILAATRGAK